MDVKTTIETRRAVRKLDPAHVMSEDEIQELMAFPLEQVAQHAAAGEGVLQVQFVDAAHERQIVR